MRKLPSRWFPAVFAFLMAGSMSFLMSGIVTVKNLGGVGAGFVSAWMGAWALAFSIAFPIIFVLAPMVRRLVGRIVESPPIR